MNIKQVGEAIWEIEKEGTMKVPAYIFGTQKVMEKMKTDRTLLQLQNVASLEGIVERAMVMPDGHEGYGFPIGGVAAFDAEEGVISPGGIGYDINCLPGDAKILDEFGAIKEIQSYYNETHLVQNDGKIVLAGLSNANLVSLSANKIGISKAPYIMRKTESGQIYQIRLASGQVLRATGEHPVLTRNGMVPAKELKIGDEVGVLFFEGVEHEPPSDEIIFDGSGMSREIQKELIGRNLLPLTADHPQLPRLARLAGYIFGDGSIHESDGRMHVSAFGKKDDLEKVKRDIEALGFSAKIYRRVRASKIETQYGAREFQSDSAELHTSSRAFAQLMAALGVPTGKKTSQNFEVPRWIRKSRKWVKRLFLAAFFGAEMSAPNTLSKTSFYSAVVGQNKNKECVESARLFMLQIAEMLYEFGIKSSEISVRDEHRNRKGETVRLRLMISGEENLIKLWKKIGFEYNEKRSRLAEVACAYIHAKNRVQKQRSALAKKVQEYKKQGFMLKEIQKMFVSEIANARFIERAYYEGSEPRITLSFKSFKAFSETKLGEIAANGVLFEKIESIETESFNGYVFDFNVEETHNFVANGIVVSNCGVRLVRTGLTVDQVKPKIKQLADKLFVNVPSGVGSEGKLRLQHSELDKVAIGGTEWAVDNGYGWKEDLERTEEYGRMEGADPSKVTPSAKARGKSQLGTLGAGNHFLEIQKVEKIMNESAAKSFGLAENEVVVMIHCGSRGYGHQICTDNLGSMLNLANKMNLWLPDRELVYAPIKSKEAQDYLAGMKCAVNFAFANRQLIMHWVRQTFDEVMGKGTSEQMNLIYDVAHNIAKVEEHEVGGKRRKLMVHRKGATRAFHAGRPELPPIYRNVGQPVIIPGSMGTASYVLVGNPKGEFTWGTTCHGSGRVMSRGEAIRTHDPNKIVKDLAEREGVYIRATDKKVISEEAPDAYKNVDDVVASVASAGISDIVARVKPLAVVKG